VNHSNKIFCLLFTAILVSGAAFADPLPSWNNTGTKSSIIEFVNAVTDPDLSSFVPVADRIAVFDNDGTLWGEQPVYFQFLFALDRLQEMARDNPDIITSDVLRAAVAGDMGAVVSAGEAGLLEVVNVSHSSLSVDEFQTLVSAWMETATHPVTGRSYADMTYQPMQELLRYLRDEDFTTYIVSGGGVHFMRAFAEKLYGIPPNQVIGSAGESRYEVIDGVPTVMKDPGIAFIDDRAGKPVAIDSKIGKRPIFAAGNSDGDFEMLEWSTSGEGPCFAMIVHHTDADREYAYDRGSSIGGLERGLDEADARDWLIVDMAEDWNRIWSDGE